MESLAYPWQKKICPFLTAANNLRDASKTSILVAAPGPTPTHQDHEGVSCQGPSCMLFLHEIRNGSTTGDGSCAFAAQAHLMAQLTQSVRAAVANAEVSDADNSEEAQN